MELCPNNSIKKISAQRDKSECVLLQLGRVDYQTALTWQKQLLAGRSAEREQLDVLMLLEHPPVYTYHRPADCDQILQDLGGVPLYQVERGGQITYHGPGQLVGYPILDLRQHRQDLHWYLRQLEQVLIDALVHFGVPAKRQAGYTGVWAGEYKLAAIGVKVSRWVTMQGFALNVDPDLSAFERIVPCGLTRPVGSLAQFCPGIGVEEVLPVVAACFGRVFDREMIAGGRQLLLS
ncbi:lipoyl(octanoyl) transferase LipB [Gloeobacter kilaueensis]|uniref:Octanoyltransferase n=1 Tax=Gloeobacter kilaueensis (strain ATCC BAA-2537 / CCAP 1431/1 / ULC 316 / JS1) TaxID=1183438 RepID=U5QIR2_GLOK1|nr:lipoyl(octanoyl) transferase LipB [Gloeobacter kilaueensis]AGY58847.1 lipoate-protein ligase B [Gloeobacter kilaueensis JS1]